MEDLVLKSERLAMEIDRDLEMPRIKRNLSQILSAGNQLWRRTVGTSVNREASEVKASVLLGAHGYDYPKVSRNLDNLVSRAVKNYSTISSQPVLRETDIKGFVKCEREYVIIKIIEEAKTSIKDQVEKLYWDTVQGSWRKEKLGLLDSISLNLENSTTDQSRDVVPRPLPDQSRFSGDNINEVALECEQSGQFEKAVELYDSICQYEKVLKILIMLLSEVLPSSDESTRGKLEDLALKIANKYCEPQVDVPREIAGTFYLLVDLMTFFNYYHTNRFREALETMQKLKILPFSPSQVEAKSREFERYPEEVRRNISEILMATMDMLYASYKDQPTPDLKQKAEAIITFSGMINYKLPSATIARMIELEVLINSYN